MIIPPTQGDTLFKAEIRTPTSIWVWIDATIHTTNKSMYKLVDANGISIPLAKVLPHTADQILIVPAHSLDVTRVYFLEMPQYELRTFCSYDGWFRYLYSAKELGANLSEDGKSTAFRIFAPRAAFMRIFLYKSRDDTEAFRVEAMHKDAQGVWEMIIPENLKGIYYDITVHGARDPGNHFYETNPVHISDPYARVSDNTWGKCRVWEKTIPASPLRSGIPKMEDVIAYEVHVQDFTELLPIDNTLKGTFLGMIKSGLRNSKRARIGFDYLVDLGVNVVHLMPVQEYLHLPDEDWKTSFKDDPFMIEQGIDTENYQWGYRTTHAFAVESKYRAKNTEPGEERDQFRDLVQAFHDRDMAVIIDIVPNHTGENMDGNQWFFNFNALDKMYYYRTKAFEHIGAFGNEVKTEDRPMVQRWLLDQCKHFIMEFGVDGFRIDLAGQIDQQTLMKLKQELGGKVIVYGEAWIGSNDPVFEANPDWDWYKNDAPITFFQDETRNAFKGTVWDPFSKEKDRGFAGGNALERENAKKGLSNTFTDDQTPLSGINYLDIHDNWALADQFAKRDWDGRFGVDENHVKLAATLLYTSLGPIVNHGGTEMLRSKGLAPKKEIVKKTNEGIKVFMHGKSDSYNMRNANHFVWENVGQNPSAEGIYCHYDNMYAFWQGLNAFRLSEYGKVFRKAEKAPVGYYRWVEPDNAYQLGYFVNETVLVLMNTEKKRNRFSDLSLPAGRWKLIANSNLVDHVNGVDDKKKYISLKGSAYYTIQMDPVSFRIWVKE